MNREDIYTSTGLKFFRHRISLERYKRGFPGSVISTHISPTGICNLNCDYCSVSKRDRHEEIEFDVIMRYIHKIREYGCKAVILTGGGEPTLYRHFNRLIENIFSLKGPTMEVALITNGTTVESSYLDAYPLSWVRISINNTDTWKTKFVSAKHKFHKDTTVGLSFVYAGKNKEMNSSELSHYADHIKAEYIRIVTDCLQSDEDIEKSYYDIDNWLGTHPDKRIFIQFKQKEAPVCSVCHQSYFRPYLSEINGGTVFPCDSIPLIKNTYEFDQYYAICKAGDIGLFLERKKKLPFDARNCTGCVFTRNVNLLDQYINNPYPVYIRKPIKHENFV